MISTEHLFVWATINYGKPYLFRVVDGEIDYSLCCCISYVNRSPDQILPIKDGKVNLGAYWNVCKSCLNRAKDDPESHEMKDLTREDLDYIFHYE